MKKALVVVDMQEGFIGTQELACRPAVKQTIDWALELEMPIFILEYRDYGHTVRDLDYQLWRYDKAFYLRKTEDDGSRWVMRHLDQLNLDVEEFIVCGVNRDACVYSTVLGFASNYAKRVIVPEEATENAPGFCEGMDYFRPYASRTKNVELLPMKQVIGSPNSNTILTPGIPPYRSF